MAAQTSGDDVVIIKKYANRRLYDTESSSYITLDRLAEMVRQKREFKVIDAKSGDDITHNVLTQIIMDEESRGQTLLPVSFLRQLIGMYGGGQMQAMLPQISNVSVVWDPPACSTGTCQGVTVSIVGLNYHWISPIAGLASLAPLQMPTFQTYLPREIMGKDPNDAIVCP